MARKRKGAGALNHLVTFQRRVVESDPYGNERGAWQDEFTVPARLKPKMGSEEVTASRLQGIQPFIMTVRSSAETRQITPAWRAYDAREGLIDGDVQTPARAFDIKTAANIDERNAYIEMLVVDSGAV
ncbi:head-tail adaptor protein [Nitratireductor kimnyeongensis]|uniref:Head-tail adaptor protein n=1 Tax=Nitratireductor kimnyeongensis TaxID=430679 RepID=A0ABW0T511_9HYPH|nr:head-tail adaptor protein [Nitratireductor kimnyeongensis]QZZ34577.1 head-tail adaptor protein [Nitratireductor kimnyeongensis]